MAIIQRISKSGDVSYIVRVRDGLGRWFPAKTFDRQIDASRYERTLLLSKDKGEGALPAEARQILFRDYWKQWSKECRSKVSLGWQQSQDSLAERYVLPSLGQLKLASIRAQDISRVLRGLEAQGLGPQSRLHVYNLLHKMFDNAIDEYEILGANPVRKKDRPRIIRTERNFLKPAESWRLLEEARHCLAGPAIWIGLLSGLRPGEVLALRWSAVDLDSGEIVIRATFNKKLRIIQDHPKQGDWGRVPMPPSLVEFLREKSVGQSPEDFVCKNAKGGMLSYESLVESLTKLCDKIGVKRITPHELRHSCTELYVEAGANAEDLRRLLNHKSPSSTLRYIHKTDERLRGIASKVQLPVLPPPNPVQPKLRLVSGGA